MLEHPRKSYAFKKFDLGIPSRGARTRNLWGDWLTEVDQAAYGHKAQKTTWIVAHGLDPFELDWSVCTGSAVLCPPGKAKGRPRRTDLPEVSKAERELTPAPFAELLIRLASQARVQGVP